ncbi:MAG: DUF2911 domain-containing protein [Balneolaceae bacterium]|nr:MAG: DUF2911 domain-containing protein [Balneolaceae bacterium]
MKTYLIGILFAAATLFATQHSFAQERTTDRVWASPNASVAQTIGLTEIYLTYGRPSVNERQIFGGLVPFNEVWRTGANESTAIVFSDDVLIEGELVPEGTYSLYTIPGEGEWTIIINNKLSWGTQYDAAEDFLRVTVQPEESFYMEQMMIYFENITNEDAHLVIHWDTTKVPLRIELAD